MSGGPTEEPVFLNYIYCRLLVVFIIITPFLNCVKTQWQSLKWYGMFVYVCHPYMFIVVSDNCHLPLPTDSSILFT